MLASLTLAGSEAGWLAGAHRYCELASHFRVQGLGAALLCTVLLILFRDWRWCGVAVVSVVLNGTVILPLYLPVAKPAAAAGGIPLRLLLCNVFTANRDTGAVPDLVRSEAPDVVILQEIDDRWAAALSALTATYPHAKVITRQDNFGLGLWSRQPLRRVDEVAFGEFEVPTISAQLELGRRNVTILATHPVPPASAAGFAARNAQLSMIASLARKSAAPAILIGDLNTTMWSPFFSQLVRESGMSDARKGFGVLPTWPTFWPILSIPLDHCLITPGIEVKGIRTGPKIGSDHLPVIVDLLIP